MSEESTAADTGAESTETTATEETGKQTETTQSKGSEQQTTESKETKQETKTQESGKENWRSRIQDESIRKFADRFTSEEDLAKTAFEFRQKLSNAITKPGKNASEEEVQAYRKALGVPDSPDDYKITVDERAKEFFEGEDYDSLNEIVSEFKKDLHAAGATQEVTQAAIDKVVDFLVKSEENEDEIHQESFKKAEDALRKKWGPEEYNLNKEYAKRGYKQFGTEDFMKIIESLKYQGVPLANHPAFAEPWANVGRKMGEGGLQTVISEDEKKTTEEKLDQLTEDAQAAMSAGDRIKADRLFAERSKLSQQYYGE